MDFEVNDLVKIKEREYNRYTKDVPWRENVFRILSIDGSMVKLSDIDNDVPICDVEPIPIDGKSDACIYYVPALMAGIGEPILKHRDNDIRYFVDGFAVMHIDGHTLKDEFMAEQFHYIHEVQHWLHKDGSHDELRVMNTLK